MMNFKQVTRAQIVEDWYLQLHKTRYKRFKQSLRGKDTTSEKSPFAENKELTMRFKMWARSDIEHLSVIKAHNFINNKLLSKWTAQELMNNKISYPVSLHVCARWTKEAGFCYQRHKKTYYVDRHEAPDIVADRNNYVRTTLPFEIYEHC